MVFTATILNVRTIAKGLTELVEVRLDLLGAGLLGDPANEYLLGLHRGQNIKIIFKCFFSFFFSQHKIRNIYIYIYKKSARFSLNFKSATEGCNETRTIKCSAKNYIRSLDMKKRRKPKTFAELLID